LKTPNDTLGRGFDGFEGDWAQEAEATSAFGSQDYTLNA
jgi:hypothetical protein